MHQGVKGMNCMRLFLLSLLIPVLFVFGQELPYDVTGGEWSSTGELRLRFKAAANTYVYAESLKVVLVDQSGVETDMKRIGGAAPKLEGEEELAWRGEFELIFKSEAGGAGSRVKVSMQGCNDKGMCFMPMTKELTPGVASPSAVEASVASGEGLLSPSWIVGQASGYMDVDSFMGWLDRMEGIEAGDDVGGYLDRIRSRYGLWLVGLLLIPFGLLLNLTPCVLPMIPVNLAILGAGKGSKSRGVGLLLGLWYALGMCLSYGLLGLIVVLVGGQFGSVNSSWLFNVIVGVVFLVLGLSMFGFFELDLARFRGGGMWRKGTYVGAFAMGCLTAVLAGSCVAPVLIWVLLLSAEIYSSGGVIGLLFPFLLGLGMALPWPFLGCGIGMLPKPGGWMVRLRQAFGVIILLVAGYYFYVGYQLFGDGGQVASDDGWRTDVKMAFAEAREENKPILLDFWGISCKNCVAMDSTTLANPKVRERLDNLVCVKVRGDDKDDGVALELVKSCGIIGFPTYVYLRPN